MPSKSPVTYCARAKLLTLIDGKFGAFLVSQKTGSLELHFYDEMPRGNWVQLENYPRVFVDHITFNKIRLESSIDFQFDSQEFVISR